VLINNIMDDCGRAFFIVCFFSFTLETRLQNHFLLSFFHWGEGEGRSLTGELIKYHIAFHSEMSSAKKVCGDSFGLSTDA